MSLDVANLKYEMLRGAKATVAEKWPAISTYAEEEFAKIAQNLVDIERMLAEGKISEKKARMQIQMQKNAAESVLLAVEGMTVLVIEELINAALGAIKGIVNKATGFSILP